MPQITNNHMSGFINVFSHWRYFVLKAIIKLQIKYKQTSLGLLWEPLSIILVTVSITLIWSLVLGEKNYLDFYIYVFIGYYLWTLISSIINQGINVYEKHRNEITNENRHLLFYILEEIVNCLVRFLMVIPILILVVVLFANQSMLIGLIGFLITLVLIIGSAIGFMATFGTISLLYKDVRHVIQSIMRLAFLLTPIIWRTERLGEYESYVWLNPFYAYIKISREALMSGSFDFVAVGIGVLQTLILLAAGGIFITRYEGAIKRRIFLL